MQTAFRTAHRSRDKLESVSFHGDGVKTGKVEQFLFAEAGQTLIRFKSAAFFEPSGIVLREPDDFKEFREFAQGNHLVRRVIVSDADLCNPDSLFHFSLLFFLCNIECSQERYKEETRLSLKREV